MGTLCLLISRGRGRYCYKHAYFPSLYKKKVRELHAISEFHSHDVDWYRKKCVYYNDLTEDYKDTIYGSRV